MRCVLLKSVFYIFFLPNLLQTYVCHAQEEHRYGSQNILYDATQSETFGSCNLRALHRAAYQFGDKYIPDSIGYEKSALGRLAGMGYRASKLGLFDFQQDYLIALLHHEMFGHGARFREFGFIDNSVHVSMFFPFAKGEGRSTYGDLKPGYNVTAQESITIALGGNEANLVLANNLSEQMLLNGSVHYREALLYLVAQNNELFYIRTTRRGTKYKGDITVYLLQLNNLYNKTPGNKVDIDKLVAQSMVSLLNPMQLYAAFTIVYTYGIMGRRTTNSIPMIGIGKVKYLPAFNYSLTPFGPEFHSLHYLKYKDKLLDCDLHLGDATYNKFYGMDIHAWNLIYSKRITATFHLNVWGQPELELEKYAVKSNNTPGAELKADITIRPLPRVPKAGIFMQAGYKTKGYVQGEALDKGFIFRVGINIMNNEAIKM